MCRSDDTYWPADQTHPSRVRFGSDHEIRQATEERQRFFFFLSFYQKLPWAIWGCHVGKLHRDPSDGEMVCMRTQEVVDITTSIQIVLHYNQVHLLTTVIPPHQNCPHQIDPFLTNSNPHNARFISSHLARLCGDKTEFCHQHD